MGRAATGTLRKMKSGRWQARYQYPDGVRRPAPTTFLTKRDANAWLAQVHADVTRGQWSLTDATVAVLFSDYAARWVANRKVKGRPLADRTRTGYQDLLDKFILPTFGHLPLHTITREMVDRWYDRTAPEKPTYQARAYSLLRTILGTAVDDGHLPQQVARVRGGGQVERRHSPRVATPAELAALTEAMPERYRLMVLLGAWCALRFGELTELRRHDIDTRAGVVKVRRSVVLVDGEFVVKTPKSSAGVRDVHVPAALMPLVRDHLLRHAAPGADGLLFPAKDDPSKHLRQSSLARVFYPAREKAGMPDLRFHDLRHTGAVFAARSGATLAELMSRLGHSTSQAALRYQHAAEERDARIAAALSDMIVLSSGEATGN